MAYGIQIYNENEELIFDLANCTTYILGTGKTNGKAGSVSNSKIKKGRTWIIVTGAQDAETRIPMFSVEDGMISWNQISGAWYSHEGNVDFMYGTY